MKHKKGIFELQTSSENKYCVIFPRTAGLFSLLFQVLGRAYLCEKEKKIPIVFFNHTCPYWTENHSTELNNAWEYYFEPISNVKLTDLLVTKNPESIKALEKLTAKELRKIEFINNVEIDNKYSKVIDWYSPLKIKRQRKFVNCLYNKYIKIKPEISQDVSNFIDSQFGNASAIGVHYRAIEKSTGKSKDPTSKLKIKDSFEIYIETINEELLLLPQARIYVATDSKDFLDRITEVYGTRVINQKCQRLNDAKEENIGLHYLNRNNELARILGEEVIKDALILSSCATLIHGISNVSEAALYMNCKLKSRNIEYERLAYLTQLKLELKRIIRQFGKKIHP